MAAPTSCLLVLLLLLVGVVNLSDAAATAAGQPQEIQRHDIRRRDQRQQLEEETTAESTTTNQNQKKEFHHYVLWEPSEIKYELMKWQKHYPDFVRVTTAQEAYGLPVAGGKDDCPFDPDQDGCLNYFLTIQDFATHPEGSKSSARLPEVLWSGELHGNERVGPTAVMEAAQLLLEMAACESNPRVSFKGTEGYEEEVHNAISCRAELESRGFSDWHRQWLSRLVSTRRIVVVPTANALGYYRVIRTEGNIDANRDFPYDQEPGSCMQTIAGRTLNEIFREHMFQLSLTFHGGMEVIGYEWGAPHWKKPTSPDDNAQSAIAAAYSHYGGGWSDSKPYDYGNMNEFVYPVHGGMEDWAYAASWDTERVTPCNPTTFGGYPAEKTTYGPSTLRVFNMLVESSNNKIPPKSMLGTSQQVLKHNSKGNGYVSRNIRLSLLAAELVEPYVVIREANELKLSDDIIPLGDPMDGRDRSFCQKNKAVSVPANSRKVVIQWTVGGAITIDSTQVWYAKWDDIPEDKIDCGLTHPHMLDVEKLMKNATAISEMKGTGQFDPHNGPSAPFAASIDITGFSENDKIVVVASAKVDSDWAKKPKDVVPDLPPQSHIVNARTNNSWHHESEGKVIQGRLHWFSTPLTIVLRKPDDQVETVELSSRLTENKDQGDSDSITTSTSEQKDKVTPGATKPKGLFDSVAGILLFVGVLFALVFVAQAFIRYRMRIAQRSRVREYIEDGAAPTPGLRQKGTNSRQEQQRNGYVDIPGSSELELGEFS